MPSWTLRARLTLLTFLVLLPVLFVIVHQNLDRRRASMAAVERRARMLARDAAAEQEDRLLHRGDQLLRVLVALPDVLRHDSEGCGRLLADLVKLYQGYAELGAATVDGAVVCSTNPTGLSHNIGDRAYFRRALETRGSVAGGYETGRITGRAVIVLARAAVDRNGETRAVVFAGVDLDRMTFAPGHHQLPQGGAVTVLDADGRILGGYPAPIEPRGAVFSDSHVTATAWSQRSGTLEASSSDGIARLVAFEPVRGLDRADYARVLVAVPLNAMRAGPDSTLVRNLLVIALAGLVALGIGWIGADLLFLRGVRGLLTVTKRLAAGDLRAEQDLPGGNGELAQLSRAFAGMAETIESRSRAIEEARASRRATESALASEQRFVAAVLDVIGALVVVLDGDGRIVRFNRACERTTGYTEAEVHGRAFWELFVRPDDVASVRQAFDDVRSGGLPATHERAWLTKDGRECVIAWSTTLLDAIDGATRYVIAAGIDTTDRKRTEDELRKSEATAHAFLEAAAEGVVIADGAGRIVLVNAEIERVFGYSREELLGRPVETLLPERLVAKHASYRAGYVTHPSSGVISVDRPGIGRTRDGTEVPIELKLSAIQTEDGPRIMTFVTDITERRARPPPARQSENHAARGPP